jgi:isopenicillin-N epimerase
VPECIRFLGALLPGGWAELMARNHSLAVRAGAIVAQAAGVAAPCPETMLGSMASVPLPQAAPGSIVATRDHDQVASWFRERGVEAWLYPWPSAGGMLIRVSAQLYNHEGQYERLAALLKEALDGR